MRSRVRAERDGGGGDCVGIGECYYGLRIENFKFLPPEADRQLKFCNFRWASIFFATGEFPTKPPALC